MEIAKFTVTAGGGKSKTKAFQNLLFLIRDWPYPDEKLYGYRGGNLYLEEVLTCEGKNHAELTEVRQFIHESFDSLECCLLPSPGTTVEKSSKYDGRWSEMNEEFKNEIENLVPSLLAPGNLKIKRIDGERVTGSKLLKYIFKYFELFNSEEIPKVKSIAEVYIQCRMMQLTEKLADDYLKQMKNVNDVKDDLDEKEFEEMLQVRHLQFKRKAISKYNEEKKFGGSQHAMKYLQDLEEQVDKNYKNYSETAIVNYRFIMNQRKINLNLEREKEEIKRRYREEKKESDARTAKLEEEKDKMSAEMYKQKLEYEESNKLLIENQRRLELEMIKREKKLYADMMENEKEFGEIQMNLRKNDDLIKSLKQDQTKLSEEHQIQQKNHEKKLQELKDSLMVEQRKSQEEMKRKQEELTELKDKIKSESQLAEGILPAVAMGAMETLFYLVRKYVEDDDDDYSDS